MKPNPTIGKPRGYVTFLMVIAVSIVCMGLILMAYKATIRAQETQKVVQVRVDADQREGAILRALLGIVPNRAIIAMSANSSATPTTCQWSTIFSDALALANAGNEDTDGVGAAVSSTARVANMADYSGSGTTIFQAVDSTTNVVTAGINASPGSAYPPYLTWSSTSSGNDTTYPIITTEKYYGANAAGTAELSLTDYPIYNRIPYPNIRFGYAQPGARFVAKRNWWAFTVTYPSSIPGLARQRKRYVLSIYEVPSQVALSGSAYMSVGTHSGGTNWSGVQIQGSVFGDRILSEGSISANRVSSRKGITIQQSPIANGTTVPQNFDQDNTQQTFEANGSGFYPVSVAGGTGRVAFIPLNRGTSFYNYVTSTDDSNRISPTGWNNYTLGARQCEMRVLVQACTSSSNQTPTKLAITYKNGASTTTFTATRGSSGSPTWPTTSQTGGSTFPFQSETTATGRRCLTVYIDKLRAWLIAKGATNLADNDSIVINPDSTKTGVRSPSFPSIDADMALVIRGGSDLTAYPKGLSIVTNMRTYFADDVNVVTRAAASGSGLTGQVYPPFNVFAPEKRWGVITQPRVIRFRGQMATMDSGSGNMVRPLDLKTGLDQLLPDNIDARLSELTSPAQLPPVNFMNWLVTVEEVGLGGT